MIGPREAAQWAARFGVAVEQIRRDHLVSAILTALPQLDAGHVTFIGGTALARTHLDGLRVSEDIDLLAADPGLLAGRLTERLPRLLRRHYPGLIVHPASRAPRSLRLLAESPDVAAVQVQVIRMEGAEATLDYESRPVVLRYADFPAVVESTVPTAETFTAMKLATYRDRQEPRDLFDLAHLAERGALTSHAAGLLRKLTGSPPHPSDFRAVPRRVEDAWQARLAHQTGELISADEALARVRRAIERLDNSQAD